MKITIDWLRAEDACSEQVVEFEKLFGSSAEFTLDNLMRARHLDLDWLASSILSAAALEEYAKATAAAREEYEKATAAAREEYGKAAAAAWEEYKKAEAPAWEEYKKAAAPAWEEYRKAAATALWEAWANDTAREGEE